ncbi:E3 ubiquitin/ISG15 ligase TRIM25-like isoform X2 [Puntigrus tetrazona]|uniref:E3 ubiquitin/ISG15 ligase TRIM25-like isoform X2 n=1 Tax=Puntigrus tetrazona TaxID=1606681 RepID=UPI001C8ADD76|nr:E3 ubiquitin/ISG15 ligase TRIM25-like isoform X2 [Puntigrus tetrazona]
MAEGSILVEQDQFSCPVCLDLLKNPVTIPCGHSFCMSCITHCWNQEDQKGVYSCPQCRQTFVPRPVLGKNTILTEMVEKLKKTKLQAPVPARAGDVECDICTETKHIAVKSCLVCLESYCQTHFDRHEEFRSGKPHKVIDATGRLQQMICPQHHKQLEIYCQTDKSCICYLCTMDEHKNHDTITALAERTRRQKNLEQIQNILKQKIPKIEADLQELREDVKTYKKAVEESERNFNELIIFIERSRSEVTQIIRDREKAAVSRAEERMKKLEQEIGDLKSRNTELEKLLQTDDHIHFLQSFHKELVMPYLKWPKVRDTSILYFEDVGKSISLLKEKIQHFCKEEIEKISRTVYSCSFRIKNHWNRKHNIGCTLRHSIILLNSESLKSLHLYFALSGIQITVYGVGSFPSKDPTITRGLHAQLLLACDKARFIDLS